MPIYSTWNPILLAALNGLNLTRAGFLFSFLKDEKCVTWKESHHEESFTEVCMRLVQLFSTSVLLSVLQVTLCHRSAALKSCIATTC